MIMNFQPQLGSCGILRSAQERCAFESIEDLRRRRGGWPPKRDGSSVAHETLCRFELAAQQLIQYGPLGPILYFASALELGGLQTQISLSVVRECRYSQENLRNGGYVTDTQLPLWHWNCKRVQAWSLAPSSDKALADSSLPLHYWRQPDKRPRLQWKSRRGLPGEICSHGRRRRNSAANAVPSVRTTCLGCATVALRAEQRRGKNNRSNCS